MHGCGDSSGGFVYPVSFTPTGPPGNQLSLRMATSFRRTLFAAAGVALLSGLDSACATLLAYDGFDHPAGALVGKTAPTGFSSAYTAFGSGANVSSPGATYPGLPVTGNKVDLGGVNSGVYGVLTNSPEAPGTTLYFSYMMQVATGTGYAGISFFQGTTETLYTGSRSNLFGIDPKGGTAGNSASSVTSLSLVVFRVDFTASGATIRLYVNPTSAEEPASASATATKTSALTFDRIRIESTNDTGTIDEFRLGTTFADVAPIAPGFTPTEVLVLGSSVASGTGANPQSLGWAYRLEDLLENHAPIVPGSTVTWQVNNASIGGDTTSKVLARFQTDVVNAHPGTDIIIIALSLANEGLVGADDAGSVAAYESFRNGMLQIINLCRGKGYYPVVSLSYPNDNYSLAQYAFVRKINLLLNSWDVPSMNFLGATDNGAGHWAPGFVNDAYHPNASGHAELFLSVVPSLFDAITAGKLTLPQIGGTTSYLRLQRDAAEPAPVRFSPAQTMHSFTLSFRVRTTDTGTIAAVGSGANRATLEIRSNALVYVGPTGAELSVPLAANNDRWYDIALSHLYATTKSLLYVDGVLKGTVTDNFIPDLFVVGGAAGASGRALAPLQADFQDVCLYRAAWTQDEALAQDNGVFQQASLEICSPLADTVPINGTALENRAQSLTALTLKTAKFIAMAATPPDALKADSFASGAVSLTWAGHGSPSSPFTIERRRSGVGEAWVAVATSPGNASFFEDSGLTAGASYDYRIRAQEGSLQGDYSNVVSVAAGGQSAVSYQDWISGYFTEKKPTYLIDFDASANPAYNGVKWNTVSSPSIATPYPLVDTTNASDGYSLAVSDSFDQTRADAGAPLTDFAAIAQSTLFAIRDDVPLTGGFTFSGLNPASTYDFSFFAHRGSLQPNFDYSGVYTFTGAGSPVSVEVNAATSTALTKISGLTPNASGVITLNISAGSGAGTDFAVINFIQMVRVAGDTAYTQNIKSGSDPDGDGRTNFEEYARGFNPTKADDRPFTLDSFGVKPGGSDMEFRISRNRRAKDVNYVLEKSADLKNWQADPQASVSVLSRIGDLETVAYASPASPANVFFRLRIY